MPVIRAKIGIAVCILCSELLNTLYLCLSFLVRSRILGKILRVSKMLVPDGIFSLTSCRGSWGRKKNSLAG